MINSWGLCRHWSMYSDRCNGSIFILTLLQIKVFLITFARFLFLMHQLTPNVWSTKLLPEVYICPTRIFVQCHSFSRRIDFQNRPWITEVLLMYRVIRILLKNRFGKILLSLSTCRVIYVSGFLLDIVALDDFLKFEKRPSMSSVKNIPEWVFLDIGGQLSNRTKTSWKYIKNIRSLDVKTANFNKLLFKDWKPS